MPILAWILSLRLPWVGILTTSIPTYVLRASHGSRINKVPVSVSPSKFLFDTDPLVTVTTSYSNW
jgi:hypothetical protein